MAGKFYKTVALTSGGGTLTLDLLKPITYYKITGSITLAASWVIEGSNMEVGDRISLKMESDIDLNGNTLTIFGKTAPQSIADRDFFVDAIYNGSTWDVNFLLDFSSFPLIATEMIEDEAITTALIKDGDITIAKLGAASVGVTQLVTSSVSTAKIADANVTLAKLASDLIVETLVIPVSFETGEQCDNSFKIYSKCDIVSVSAYVTKAIAGTDDATITLEINGRASSPSVITLPASSALNTVVTITPSSLNDVIAGATIKLISAKTTVGGKALVSVKITRSA